MFFFYMLQTEVLDADLVEYNNVNTIIYLP